MQVLSGAGLFTAPGAGDGVHWVEHLRASDLSVGTYSVRGAAFAEVAVRGADPRTEPMWVIGGAACPGVARGRAEADSRCDVPGDG
jgi:hypothetical protein